jgi:hypothetical protein
MDEEIILKLGMYIMALERISNAYSINHILCSYLYMPFVAGKRFGKNFTATTNTSVPIEVLWDAIFFYDLHVVSGE